MLKMYGYFRSSASYRLRIALNYKKIQYEVHAINLTKNEQSNTTYLSINPQGLVPALLVNDHVLTQSLSILEYVEEIYPEPHLLPNDPFGKQRVRSLSQLIACEIQPLNNSRVLNYLSGHFHIDDDERLAWCQHWLSH